MWPAIPVVFLDTMVGQAHSISSGATDQRFGPP
jgi:hypothetical protein